MEYDSDEIGELDDHEDDEDMRGDQTLDQFDDVLEDFVNRHGALVSYPLA